jgi:RNase H-like domain found in reverse transcriptase/Reverse transcriptase (RNA-dependent DNA polymerase)
MNTIFTDLVAAGKVAVYLDDILIYSSMPDEHRDTTHEVLRRLRAHDLYLRPEKCEFDREEVEYLGLIIKKGEVTMDPIKVKAVTDWPTPRNLRELRGFLGFANFYRRFIKDFAKLARPLNDLTKKDIQWTWNISQRQAFQTLKESFSRRPILAVYKPNCPMRLEVDASGYATGGVLLQKLDDNRWHPIAFRSQSMVEAERNYEIYDKEMLTIIRALEDWRHYLEGLPRSFDIISDHRNLEYWHTAQNLTRRQARWSLYLSCFDFHLTHKPGTANTQADPLSRIPTHLVTDADDNRDLIV